MIRPDRIDALLNDAELNLLADLFLARFGFDVASAQYRQFRNAVVMFSYGTSLTVDEILRLIADCDGISHGALVRGLEAALRKLPRPVCEAYNARYAPPAANDRRIRMKLRLDLKYTISFLGTVFLYLTNVNYKRIMRISATELKRAASELKKARYDK